MFAPWLIASAAFAAPPATSTTYRLTHDEAELTQIKRNAMDASLAAFSAFARPFAKPRLDGLFRACPEVVTHVQGDDFMVQCKGKDPFRWRVGAVGPYDDDGKQLVATLNREGDVFTLDFKGDGEGKTLTYTFTPTGLDIRHHVYSDKLEVPMDWLVRYLPAS